MGRRLIRANAIARPFAPAIIGAFVAIAAACAGFHEPPNLFQLVSMVTGAALAALVAPNFKKI
ncbi:hypothetical protein ACFVYA_13515 [Amycolatopsis sp. NPDC058278]|uniref:hypothetical protein n=1 Tax=Amycolatopsis sp. NPDC058278 TaxID=3346417 RepID=UPI0036DCAE7E